MGDLPEWRTGKRGAAGAGAEPMAVGASGSLAGAKKPQQRKAARKAEAGGELETAVVTLQKLALRETAGIREFANFMNEFWLVPFVSPVAKASLEGEQTTRRE